MPTLNLRFKRTMTNIAERTASYLKEEAGIEIHQINSTEDAASDLPLDNLTAMIGIGGASGILVAFSFPQALAQVLLDKMIEGIDIPAGEEASFLHGAIAEIANIIVGNALFEPREPGTHVPITPPVLVEGGRCIRRQHGARFGSIVVETDHGMLNVHLIGPEALFSHYLKRAS